MTRKIQTLNAISKKGLARLPDSYAVSGDAAEPDAILVRSQVMHEMPIPASVLAIGRAGAGTNNLPIKAMSERGVVVCTSSIAAFEGQVGQAAYAASKGGVASLTLPAARELAASGIRVNTIVPGPTNTPMMAGIPDEWTQAMIRAIPLGRMGEPAEIAAAAVFLASDEAGFITGQNLAVNGGMSFL